jgi:RNA polymerase sigma-70 factor (ECF subfamily)
VERPTGGAEAATAPSARGAGAADPGLVARARARDPEALGVLFDLHIDRLYGLAYRLTGARVVAEDLVQDTFLRVHRGIESLDPARDPGPWFTAILVNLVRDRWRSGAQRIARASSPLGDDGTPGGAAPHASAGDEPEQRMLDRERERLVQEALLRLPDDLRALIVLRDWQGLGHEEIADLLGVSHAAARKRYSRALERLARLLKETIGT